MKTIHDPIQVMRKMQGVVGALRGEQDIPGIMLRAVQTGLLDLGVPFDYCGINWMQEANSEHTVETYSMHREGERVKQRASAKDAADVLAIWQLGRTAYRPDLAYADELVERQELESFYGVAIRAVLDVPFSGGTLAINSTRANAFSAVDISNVEQLALLLSGAVTRLRDLQQLEEEIATHRQTNAELLAERQMVKAEHDIRLAIASMSRAGDLHGIVERLSQWIRDLGVEHDACTIQVVDAAGVSFDSFDSSKEASLSTVVRLLQGHGDAESANDQRHPWVLEVWRTGRPHYQPCTTAELNMPVGWSILDVPFSHGTLALNKCIAHAFNQHDIDLVGRFAQLLSEGMHRIVALVASEYDQQRKEVVQDLQQAIWQMQDTEHMSKVLVVLHAGLQRLGIPFDFCGVNLVDATSEPPRIRGHELNAEDEWVEVDIWGQELILDLWRRGGMGYRRDLHTEDLYGEQELFAAYYGIAVRSVLDIAFSHGTLAINSRQANAFSALDIATLEELAEVLSGAFIRQGDLLQLKERQDQLQRQLLVAGADNAVRQLIAAMREPEDMAKVTSEMGVQLKALGVDFDSCAVQIFVEDGSTFFSRSIDKARDWATAAQRATGEEYAANITRYPWVVQAWKTGQLHYQPCTAADSPMPVGWSVVDAPFVQGTLALNKRRADAFSAEDLDPMSLPEGLVMRLISVLTGAWALASTERIWVFA